MGITKMHDRLVTYLMSLKKLLLDTAGNFLVRQWKSIEKKDILSIEDSMLPEVLRIHDEGFENQSSDNLIKYSKNSGSIFYIIKSNDRIVGYCTYYLKPNLSLKGLEKQSVISSIAIDRNFRDRGFAERLLRSTIKEMKVNGVSSILLYVNVDNHPAIQLYEKIGFRIIKQVEDICGQKEICHEMELKLV
jgi:ribosomal-protein-alanine N-acetyltransferase